MRLASPAASPEPEFWAGGCPVRGNALAGGLVGGPKAPEAVGAAMALDVANDGESISAGGEFFAPSAAAVGTTMGATRKGELAGVGGLIGRLMRRSTGRLAGRLPDTLTGTATCEVPGRLSAETGPDALRFFFAAFTTPMPDGIPTFVV
jgi:hypothetical protein